jgi:hypothetical protein
MTPVSYEIVETDRPNTNLKWKPITDALLSLCTDGTPHPTKSVLVKGAPDSSSWLASLFNTNARTLLAAKGLKLRSRRKGPDYLLWLEKKSDTATLIAAATRDRA